MRKHQRSSWCHQLPFSYKLHPRKLTVFPWKLMVGRCIPYWNGHFLEDMLVFRGVLGGGFNGSARLKNMIVNNYSTHIAVVESSNLKFETWNSLFFNPMSPTVTNCLTITSYSRGVFFFTPRSYPCTSWSCFQACTKRLDVLSHCCHSPRSFPPERAPVGTQLPQETRPGTIIVKNPLTRPYFIGLTRPDFLEFPRETWHWQRYPLDFYHKIVKNSRQPNNNSKNWRTKTGHPN